MSGLYGSWLGEHSEVQGKFVLRLEALGKLAESTVTTLGELYPKLSAHILISHQNLRLAVGRYFNDVVHYKTNHKIELIHPSKAAAHSIKWIALNPVLFTAIGSEEFEKLEKMEQSILLNLNLLFIFEVVDYYLRPVNPYVSEKTYDYLYRNLAYYIKTSNYSERMASLWFEELMRT